MSTSSSVYVLGSGPSLLNLTKEEKEFLATRTTIAMNKYILFWQKIGVFPTHFFLADIHYPAIKVFQESHEIISNSGKEVHYLLDESYENHFGHSLYDVSKKLRLIKSYWSKNRFIYKPWLKNKNVTYFKRPHSFDAPLTWANSLDEELFFYRGSLSVLLNLLSILPLGNQIKLLGVDLNTSGSFYDEEIQKRPDLHDNWMKAQASNPLQLHATALPLNGQPGIQAQWLFINSHLANTGRKVFCCNPHSLLVKDDLCEYSPIIE